MPHRIARRKRSAFAFGATLLGVLLVVGINVGFGGSPEETVESARRRLADARRAQAERYAPEAYAEAEQAWNEALSLWQAENSRWRLLRDYDGAERRAAEALELASSALDRALHRSDSLQAVATAQIASADARADELRRQARSLPFEADTHRFLTAAERAVAQARGALERSDFLLAAERGDEAALALDEARDRLAAVLASHLAPLPAWRAWVQETIAWSATQGRFAIVVDKMARRLYVYRSGRRYAEYPIEMGPNWLGPKLYQGDLRTPEGRYRVTRRRGPGETIYHRALDIDYPNAEDQARFERARASGALAAGARVGGLIEIHGAGGRGADWTRGCIALSNGDMESLFRIIDRGTPVTIVGSLRSVDELIGAEFARGEEPLAGGVPGGG